MDEASPDYKRLLREAQHAQQEAEHAQQEESRRRQEAERAQQDAERAQLEESRRRRDAERAQQDAERAQQEELKRRRDAERAQQEAERAQDEAERAVRKTTLPEFLDACHTYLYSSLTVQTDKSLSTRGKPENAENKIRPERMRAWEDFAEQQGRVWDTLVKSDFMLERHFKSINTLRENGEDVRQRMMSSELDLHHFERLAVDNPVSLVVERLYDNVALRNTFKLEGSVKFENHSNTLSPEEDFEEGVGRMTISGSSRRRSPRLLEQQQSKQVSTRTPPIAIAATKSKRPRPPADQFCVYNTSLDPSSDGVRIPVFIVEYKPPHKLTLGHIYEGLEDLNLDDVVFLKDTDGTKEHCQRLVAAVVVQAFSYMISAGLEFGCVRSGEASIFLMVPDDPSTVFYYLSVPKGDVGESTGWQSIGESKNRLHLTAVGQAVAFTLQALRTTPRPQWWRDRASEQLPEWQILFDNLLDAVPPTEAPSSEYRPPRETSFLRDSPIRLRHRPQQRLPTCQPGDRAYRDDSENDASDPETPSRRPSEPSHSNRATVDWKAFPSRGKPNKTTNQKYCSHQCLLGLIAGGPLDLNCSNARQHGHGHHQLDQQSFLVMVKQQLGETMDENFAPIGRHGARGVPFMVKLESHGYTLVAKCTPSYFLKHLDHETAVYSRLRSIQGIDVPVNLGIIELPRPYSYEGIVDLTHAMLLSYGGSPIGPRVNAANYEGTVTEIESSLSAIHQLRVRHRDVLPRNVLHDPITGKIVIIDFERAEMQPPRPALGVISPNRKRRRNESGFVKVPENVERASSSETGLLRAELLYLINRATR